MPLMTALHQMIKMLRDPNVEDAIEDTSRKAPKIKMQTVQKRQKLESARSLN